MKQKLMILVMVISLLGCSNDKEEETVSQLPPITQSGANTFGCYINGKLLIPRDGSGTSGGADKGFVLWGDPTGNNQYTEIDVRDYKSEKTAKILIHIQNLHQNGVGNYVIDGSNGMSSIDGLNNTYVHCKVFNDVLNSYQYYRSYPNSGTITISKYNPVIPNIQNLIISGVFTCRVRNSANPNDEIEITLGRFDINGFTLPNKIFQ